MNKLKVIEEILSEQIEALKKGIEENKKEQPCDKSLARLKRIEELTTEGATLQRENQDLCKDKDVLLNKYAICPKCGEDMEFKQEKKAKFQLVTHKRIEDEVVNKLICPCGLEHVLNLGK